MINAFNNDGTKFYISDRLPTTETQSNFELIPYTQIKGVRSIGDLGAQAQIQTNNFIGVLQQNIIVGESAQTLNLELIKIDDAGQTAIKLADKDKVKRGYKVTQKDGSIFYFTGTVSSRLTGFTGLADTKITVELNSTILEI